jgi:hypothetical protein
VERVEGIEGGPLSTVMWPIVVGAGERQATDVETRTTITRPCARLPARAKTSVPSSATQTPAQRTATPVQPPPLMPAPTISAPGSTPYVRTVSGKVRCVVKRDEVACERTSAEGAGTAPLGSDGIGI